MGMSLFFDWDFGAQVMVTETNASCRMELQNVSPLLKIFQEVGNAIDTPARIPRPVQYTGCRKFDILPWYYQAFARYALIFGPYP